MDQLVSGPAWQSIFGPGSLALRQIKYEVLPSAQSRRCKARVQRLSQLRDTTITAGGQHKWDLLYAAALQPMRFGSCSSSIVSGLVRLKQ